MPISHADFLALQARCDASRGRLKAGGAASGAQPKRRLGNEPVAKVSGAPKATERFLVRIISRRRRSVDPDNLVGKGFVDCLRYSGLIPGDTALLVDYSIRQEKAESKEAECTIVEVISL